MSRNHANPGPILRLVYADGTPPATVRTPPPRASRPPTTHEVENARRAVAAVVAENRLAASLSTHDARWHLAVDVAAAMVGGRSAILPVEARERILAKARRIGLRPFDANLVIAVVQDAQREGRALSRETQERLTLVRPADPALIADPGRRFIAALILGAILLLAMGVVTAALR